MKMGMLLPLTYPLPTTKKLEVVVVVVISYLFKNLNL